MTIKCDGLVIDVWHFITGAPVNVPMSGSGGRDHMGEVIVAGKLHDFDLV